MYSLVWGFDSELIGTGILKWPINAAVEYMISTSWWYSKNIYFTLLSVQIDDAKSYGLLLMSGKQITDWNMKNLLSGRNMILIFCRHSWLILLLNANMQRAHEKKRNYTTKISICEQLVENTMITPIALLRNTFPTEQCYLTIDQVESEVTRPTQQWGMDTFIWSNSEIANTCLRFDSSFRRTYLDLQYNMTSSAFCGASPDG